MFPHLFDHRQCYEGLRVMHVILASGSPALLRRSEESRLRLVHRACDVQKDNAKGELPSQ